VIFKPDVVMSAMHRDLHRQATNNLRKWALDSIGLFEAGNIGVNFTISSIGSIMARETCRCLMTCGMDRDHVLTAIAMTIDLIEKEKTGEEDE
jgi:hypothetical protein